MQISDKLRYILEGFSIEDIKSGNFGNLAAVPVGNNFSYFFESSNIDDSLIGYMSDSYLTEAAGQKFIDAIKRFFKWIIDKIMLIYKYIKGMFTSKKEEVDKRILLLEKKLSNYNVDDLRYQKSRSHIPFAPPKAAPPEEEPKPEPVVPDQEEPRSPHNVVQTARKIHEVLLPLSLDRMESFERYTDRIKNVQDRLLQNLKSKKFIFDGFGKLSKIKTDGNDSNLSDEISREIFRIISGTGELKDIGMKITGSKTDGKYFSTFEYDANNGVWKNNSDNISLTNQQVFDILKHMNETVNVNKEALTKVMDKTLDDIRKYEAEAVKTAGEGSSDNRQYVALTAAVRAINTCLQYLSQFNNYILNVVDHSTKQLSDILG